jgi:hypothetical protein
VLMTQSGTTLALQKRDEHWEGIFCSPPFARTQIAAMGGFITWHDLNLLIKEKTAAGWHVDAIVVEFGLNEAPAH